MISVVYCLNLNNINVIGDVCIFTSKIKNEKNLILISNLLSFYTSNIIEPGKESIISK